MDLAAGNDKLRLALRNLRANWEEVRRVWRDDVRDHFERTHLDPLDDQVTATLTQLQQLAQVLAKARRECS